MRSINSIRVLHNNKGQTMGYVLAIVFLVYFATTIVLFLLHREGLFRFEFGKEKVEEKKELVFDKNKVLELFRREELVTEKEKDLQVEAMRLEKMTKEIDLNKSQMTQDAEEIKKSMTEISAKFKQLSEEEELNLRRLAKLYEAMKAQRVAKIFSEMDEDTVAQLLVRMQNKPAAKILGEIGETEADRAARISDIIKGKFKRDLFEKIA
ncbi:MotE family protein [Candidatus Omnitrophota bacterium]